MEWFLNSPLLLIKPKSAQFQIDESGQVQGAVLANNCCAFIKEFHSLNKFEDVSRGTASGKPHIAYSHSAIGLNVAAARGNLEPFHTIFAKNSNWGVYEAAA